ncbi:MAG: glycosyltransferase [Chloroflexi bacterium]|nr:glycosyltransferase [Chloroflexota bacterium]
MSRILFLTPQLPYPPHQGAAIRNLNLIKLAAQRHRVSVRAFIRSPEEQAGAEALREWSDDVQTCPAPVRPLARRAAELLTSSEPDMARRLRSSQFARLVAQGNADVVQVEAIEMAQYAPRIETPNIFDCHNAEWLLQRRTFEADVRRGRLVGAAYSLIQWAALRHYEREACRRSAAIVAVSPEDRAALLDLEQELHVEVIPNAVDCTWITPGTQPPPANTFLFTGTLDFRPNVDAVGRLVREVWPRIRRSLPEARLTLAGRAPVAAIRRLDGVDGMSVVPSPPDMRPYFWSSAVYLAPLRAGGGSRFKLLEAMAAEMGVVSTTLGAEGIEARDGEHLRLADMPAALAEAAVELARDGAQRQRLGAAARELVQRRYDWSVLGPRLFEVYDRLLGPCSVPGLPQRERIG